MLKQQYNLDHIPTLFVATKSDLDLAQQVSDLDEPHFWLILTDVTSGTRFNLMCTVAGWVFRFQLL